MVPYELLDLLNKYDVSVHSIFMAIDLYYQVYPKIVEISNDERTRKVYLATCIGIIKKLIGYDKPYTDIALNRSLEASKITSEELVKAEQTIIAYLGGRLVRPSYYNMISTEDELQALIKIIYRASDYLKEEPKEWASKQVPGGKLLKDISIVRVIMMIEAGAH